MLNDEIYRLAFRNIKGCGFGLISDPAGDYFPAGPSGPRFAVTASPDRFDWLAVGANAGKYMDVLARASTAIEAVRKKTKGAT